PGMTHNLQLASPVGIAEIIQPPPMAAKNTRCGASNTLKQETSLRWTFVLTGTSDVFHPCLEQGFQNYCPRSYGNYGSFKYGWWRYLFMLLLLLLRKINHSAVSQD